MRKATTLLTILASVLFYMFGLSTPASADPNSPGNNGTVKIHDADTAVEDMRNEPHVCRFYVDGFKFDNNSSGQWWIQSWPPTGNGTEVMRDSWTADGKGDWHSTVRTLPDGHYKLYAKQQNEVTPGGNKQKVFWVECSNSTAPTPTPTPTPVSGGSTNGGTTTTVTGGTTSVSGGTSTTSGGTTTVTGGTVTVTGGTTTTTTNGVSTTVNGGTTRIVGGTTTLTGSTTSNTGGAVTNSGGAVLGFESAPNAVGSVSPIVEVPGGSNQQSPNGVQAGVQNGTVAGVQNGPVAGVQSLPSTSTDRTPVIPLAAMGLAIMALGGILLGRRDPQL